MTTDDERVILFGIQGSRRRLGAGGGRLPAGAAAADDATTVRWPSPQFPGDDGTHRPALAAALGDDVAVLPALAAARVFVPIVALLGEIPAEGDKNADMAAVLMTGADGRQALLTFSSVGAMAAWDPRPGRCGAGT